MNKKKIVGITTVCLLMLLAGLFAAYVSDYYHVKDKAEAMSQTQTVSIIATKSGYLYDGPGDTNAIIFYPGAKVEAIAYASLLKEIAEGGIDCYLVQMPFHLAFFGINQADEVIKDSSYTSYYLMGHSLGGAMAGIYASKHTSELNGLILLASYCTEDISNTSLSVLSLYGDEDGVLNIDSLKEYRKNLPSDYSEICIEGANHANFGNYGEQKGDHKALLSPKQQQLQVAEKILAFIEKSGKQE